MRQTFFNIYLPASDSYKATHISQTLRITLSECPLQISRLNTHASSIAENRERRMLPVVATMMRPVRQSIVIRDQFTMKFNRLLDAAASFPTILAEPGWSLGPRPKRAC